MHVGDNPPNRVVVLLSDALADLADQPREGLRELLEAAERQYVGIKLDRQIRALLLFRMGSHATS